MPRVQNGPVWIVVGTQDFYYETGNARRIEWVQGTTPEEEDATTCVLRGGRFN